MFFRETYPEGDNVERVQFDNELLRITRLIGVAGKPLRLTTSAGEPTLLVALIALVCAAAPQTEKAKTNPAAPNAKDPSGRVTLVEEVTVTAARRTERVSDTVASVSIMSGDDLRAAAALTLDDALRQVPGFSLFRRSGSRTANPTAQGVSLRGVGPSGASRAAVLSDGIPLNDPFGGWVYWGRTPRLAIERVEVVRGGASSLYGTDALGGVINLIPRQTAGNTLFADVSYGGQESATGSLFAGRKIGPLSAQVAGELFHTGGYVMVDERERGGVDTEAGATYKTLDLRIAGTARVDRLAFIRGSLFSESRENGTPLQRNDTSLKNVSMGVEREVSRAGRFGLRSYLGSQTYNQTFSAVAGGRNTESLTRRQRTPAKQFGASLQWSGSAAKNHHLVAGAEFKDVRGHSDEVVVSGGRDITAVTAGGREQTYALFGHDTLEFGGRTILTLGARVDRWRNLDGRSVTTPLATNVSVAREFAPRSETAWSPRLGLLFRANPSLTLTASTYKAFRAPTLNELYRSFRVGNVVTLANDGLVAERLTGGEAGARVSGLKGRLLLSSSVFWSELQGPVANVTQQATPDLITRQRRNLGRTRSRGVEVEAGLRAVKAVWVNIGYLFVDSTVLSFSANRALEGLRLPQVARHQATFQARYSTKPLTVSFQGRVSDGQFDDDQNQLGLGGYLLLDFFVARRVSRSVEIFAAAENLFDRRYEVGRAGVTTLGAPRLLRAGLRLNLEPR